MSKAELRRYNLAKVTAEARKKYPQIEIETPDGQVFTVDPPQFWSDKAIDPKIGPMETAREVLGEDNLAKFLDAGGTIAGFNLVLTAYGEDNGVTMGESSAS